MICATTNIAVSSASTKQGPTFSGHHHHTDFPMLEEATARQCTFPFLMRMTEGMKSEPWHALYKRLLNSVLNL